MLLHLVSPFYHRALHGLFYTRQSWTTIRLAHIESIFDTGVRIGGSIQANMIAFTENY
jgi:hypothetical protein